MGKTPERLLADMRRSPANARYSDLCHVCDHFFGPPRQKGTSHRKYRSPVAGQPPVNIQSAKGKAKAYQVRQVIQAIDELAKSKG